MSRHARTFLELIKSWADAGGMTLEQAADFLDNVAAKTEPKSSTADQPTTLATMTPVKGKH